MKKSWIRRWFGIIGIISFSVGTLYYYSPQEEVVHASSQIVDYSRTQELAQKKADLLITGYGITSVEYALIDQGNIQISGQAGVYSKTQNTTLDKNHMYGIGSISKMYTAAAVMNLVEEGLVDLDSPVTSYLKDFVMADKRYKNITVRMLLNHSSGLMGSSFQNAFLLNDKDTKAHDTLLKKLSKQSLKAAPGEFSVYSNDGFTLAEILVERVSKKSFSVYIREVFIEPLQLQYTYTSQESFNKSFLVKTYYPGFKEEMPIDSVNAIGTGGIYSTAEDLCQFATIFMKDSYEILERESLMAMENPEYSRGIWPQGQDSSLAYGLGWDSVELYPFNQYGIKALSKGGDTVFYHSALIVLPEYNMAVAVLSSDGSSSYNQIMGQEILLSALKERNSIDQVKEDKSFEQPIPVSIPADIQQYTGEYATLGGILTVEFDKDNQLVLWNPIVSKDYSQRFTHVGNGLFVISMGKNYASIEFVKESNGRVYLKNQNYNILPGIGQTASNYYVGQKIDQNTISKSVGKSWLARNGQQYFLVNEKYTSQSYPTSLVIQSLTMSDQLPGYVGSIKIVDSNLGQNILQLPGVYGRDLVNYRFYVKNKIEYLEAGDGIYVSKKGIKNIPSTAHTVKIGKDGYGQWYKIPKSLAGRTMIVTIPKKSAYAVYDGQGNCIRYSYIDKNKKTILPIDGYIMFVSEKNTKFNVFYE